MSICCSTGGGQDFFSSKIRRAPWRLEWIRVPPLLKRTVSARILPFFRNTSVAAESSRAAPGPVGVFRQVHCPCMGWAAALATLTMCLC